MRQKATLAKMQKDLGEEPKASQAKKAKKEPVKKETAAAAIELHHPPRGERGDFLAITVKLPADMLSALRTIGMHRRAKKEKDTDTSALIREAVAEFLAKRAKE
jgi:hypothetical protein